MTHQLSTAPTEIVFYDLVDLMSREYVSRADHKRIGRLARIVAARQGVGVQTVLDAAIAEIDA